MNILVWRGLNTEGNTPPDRVIDHQLMGIPLFVFIDTRNDRLFVASMPDGVETARPAVLVYDNASSLDGNVEPDYRIIGANTRLGVGLPITHNVWFDWTRDQLYVAHHTNEVLRFNLSGYTQPFAPPFLNCTDLGGRRDCNVAPSWTLQINDLNTTQDANCTSAYGLFLMPNLDRLYVSKGYNELCSTDPQRQVVKMYEDVSTKRNMPGTFGDPPSRVIGWSTAEPDLFPPQPIWVSRVQAGG